MSDAPIEMPYASGVGYSSRSFTLTYNQLITPQNQGFIQVADRTRPLWQAEYQTPPLFDAKYNAMIAFLESLRGSRNSFLGYDPGRQMPYAYRNLALSADPWTQPGQTSPRITASSITAGTISLDRMANGAIITVGDYISYYDGTAWYLYRALETRTASGNAVVNLVVVPRPHFTGTLNFNVRYRRACAEMRMIGGYVDSSQVDKPATLSFNAVQLIKRAV